MPGKVIFREIEELSGITLEEYLSHYKETTGAKNFEISDLRIEHGVGMIGGGGNSSSAEIKGDSFLYQSKRTFFTELEAIDMILKVVDLVDETLHSRDIVHTNLNPQEIFLKGRSVDHLCFPGLFYCLWDSAKILGIKANSEGFRSLLPHDRENLSRYNTKVRNKDYISPEQLQMGQELEEILGPKNGRLLPEGYQNISIHDRIVYLPEITEFHDANKANINRHCDIYSIGAILYRLLLGAPPGEDVSEHIAKHRLNEKSPASNVYQVPYFFKDFILSNDMCYILVKLLH